MRAVRDTFGAPRPGDRKHQGVDVFAPRGTPVVSTTRGIVARIGENRLGGTVVWVLGPGGDRHYYAHLNSVADIRTGQRIAPGDVLGTVGTTGNARGTPPHLHYGVYRRANGAINPFPLLTDMPAARAESVPRKRAPGADRGAECRHRADIAARGLRSASRRVRSRGLRTRSDAAAREIYW